MSLLGRRAALALAVSLALVARAGAQAPKPSPSPPAFGTGVTVVAVPVFVTDGRARAVGGLRAEDFEVLDDGKRVEIVAFHEIDAAAPDTLPAQGFAALLARRQFLLLFDLSFSSPSGLVRSRDAAVAFVEKGLGPADLAAVATFSVNDGLKLLVGFTSDRRQLVKAIESLGLLHRERSADRLNLVFSVEELPSSTVVDSERSGREVKADLLLEELRQLVVVYQRTEERIYKQKVTTLLDGFEQLAQALRSIQGRTQILYLSGGFQETVLTGAQGDEAARNSTAVVEGRIWEVQSDSYFGDAEARQHLDRAMKALAATDAIVHSLDVSGLAAGGDVTAVSRLERPGSGRESLSQIASLSGGRFIKDTNDVAGALQEILDASRRYYVLAFEAQAPAKAGRFHRLKVKVRRSGLTVSHRTGYFPEAAEKPPTALGRQFGAAEAILKGGGSGEIGLEVLPVPYRDVDGRVMLPVVLEVDGASLLERGPGDELPLEIHGYAFDPQGVVEDVVSLSATLDLKKLRPKIREHGLQAHAVFTLPPASHSVRFLVRDTATGRKGIHWLDVTVPSFEGRLLLYPALFMDDPAQWVVLAARSRATQAAATPFRVHSDPFVPLVRPRLANGRTDQLCVLAFTGGATYETGAAFEIKAQLLDKEGGPVRIGRLQLARQVAETDGFRRFVLNLTPEGVAPGEYTFRVKLKDPATGALSEADRLVRVE